MQIENNLESLSSSQNFHIKNKNDRYKGMKTGNGKMNSSKIEQIIIDSDEE